MYGGLQPQGGKCVASWATADLNRSAYTAEQRGSHPNPDGWDNSTLQWNRGHLIAHAMGGSDKDLRNFVPLYSTVNTTEKG
jgi:hypothetical protein